MKLGWKYSTKKFNVLKQTNLKSIYWIDKICKIDALIIKLFLTTLCMHDVSTMFLYGASPLKLKNFF